MAGEKGNSSTPPEARFLPTAPRPFVFVLMPFSKEFDDIYTFGIKGAAEEVGAYAERVDEQIFVENILERVYNQIAKADMIISEMTGRNPNVFYETGYAHALGKKVILLTQNAEDIPFDLRQYPHIVYGGKISVLKSQIANRIRWFIENPDTYMRSVEGNFEVFINGIRIIENRIVEGSVTKYTTINVSEDLNPTLTPARYMQGLTIDKIIACEIFASRVCM